MIVNGSAFVLIISCYIKIYISISGSQAVNTKDFHVAKRMAILVFTDFFCWAPIILFSVTAAFGDNLIGLDGAKILTIFVLPLNSCANPFLYAIFTKQFKRDCVKLCKRIEESSISRSLSSLNNRRVSLGCQSSNWRQYQSEKRGSCTNSLSATSNQGGAMHRSSTDANMYERTTPYYRKPSVDSRIEDTSITSDDRNIPPSTRLLSDADECTECTQNQELITQETEKSRRLSVGLTGTESQIFIHFERKGNITTSEAVSIKSDNPLNCKRINCTKKPMIPPELVQHNDVNENNCQTLDSIKIENATKSVKDMTAQEIYMQYCKNKERVKKRKLDKEAGESKKKCPIEDKVETRLPHSSGSENKNEHINEWRKSSNFSFLGGNLYDVDGSVPKYKSNSLVDLPRAFTDISSSPVKRRSLSSRQEGYLLLKSINRDSAYEDEDEMLEYQESKTMSANQCRQKLANMHKTQSNQNLANSETMLDDNRSFRNSSNRGSSDKESGISSEHLAS